MASNNGIPKEDFKFLKITVSEYFDARGLLVMLKVLFKDHVQEFKLSGITKTIELLNALESSGAFSHQDLTLLHDAIKLTDEFSLETELKEKIPSFPLVDKQTPFTKFTAYRQKLLKFGYCLTSRDLSKIDESNNTPLKRYGDSWAMIRDLEHEQVITPTKMADFIKVLERINLKAAVSILNEGCTPECQKETEHSTNARPIYNLPESEYAQLLVNVSDCWSKFGDINMLKVLLCDFNRIGITEIQKEDDVFNLFNLLRGSGKLSPSNIDVIAEAAFLCGVGPIEEIIKKKIPTYQYPASMDEVHKISEYRRNVIEFGFKVEATNLKTILKLSNLSHIKETDKWRLILSLELNSKLTPKNKETFVKMLRENDMTAEVDALNTYAKKDMDAIKEGINVPVEIMLRGPEMVRAFKAALEEGKKELKQGRTLFVGLERVGKTCTINSLLRKEFNPESGITDALVKSTTSCTLDIGRVLLQETSQNMYSEVYDDAVADETVNGLKSGQQIKETSTGTSPTRQEFENINSGNEAPAIKRIQLMKPQHPEEEVEDEVKEKLNFPKEESNSQIGQLQIPNKIFKKIKIRFQRQGSGSQVDDNTFAMDIWDFAGQPIYHVIQRIFMVSVAVVCVIFNLKDDLNAPAKVLDPTTGKPYDHRMTNLQFILYWIRSVYVNIRGSNHKQTVMLIGTHFDSLNGKEEDKKARVKEIEDTIWKALEGKPYEDIVFQHKIFAIENSVSFAESNAYEIMLQIYNLAMEMIIPLPIKWLQVLQEIQKLRKKDILYLLTSQIDDLLSRCEITNNKLLLEYLHDIGEILYYPDDEVLKDKIIIDLMRLVEKFKAIITVEDPKLKKSLKQLWRNLNNGKLEGKLLRHIWKNDTDEMFEFFVSLMHRFGLMCEKKTKKKERTFYVLSRLKPQRDNSIATTYDENRAISLFHDFDGYLPDDLFQRAATKFIEEFQIADVEPELSYEHVELNIDADHFVILNITTINNDRWFKTTIVSRNDDDEPLPRVCKNVLSFLEKELRVLSENDARGVEVKMYIPGCVHCSKMHFVRKFDEDKLVCGRKTMDVKRYRKLFGETELTEENFEDLLTSVSDWCDGRVNLNMLKVVVSEFRDKIALNDILTKDNTYDLIDLLRTAGLLKPTDISVLVEVIKLCGVEGVEVVIKKEWNVPTLKGVVITHFSNHLTNLLEFGRRISTGNIKKIGQLYGLKGETDPYSLILKLEEKGTLKRGENMKKFIKKLDERKMVNEVEALTHHE